MVDQKQSNNIMEYITCYFCFKKRVKQTNEYINCINKNQQRISKDNKPEYEQDMIDIYIYTYKRRRRNINNYDLWKAIRL